MTEQEGLFTIPTRLYLTAAQRTQLDHLLRERAVDLADLLTELVAAHLEHLPPAPPPATPAPNIAAELRQRRAALAKLRAQRGSSAGAAWLNAYIAEVEGEIADLEARQR